MTKIYYDDKNLKRLVNMQLETAINNLRKSIEISDMLYIPYDFKYRSYLSSLSNNLNSNLSLINNVYSIIKDSSMQYTNISNNINSNIMNVENYSLYLRNSALK